MIMSEKEMDEQIEAYKLMSTEEVAHNAYNKAIDEIHTVLTTEIAMLNATEMTDVDLYTFAVRIKEITDKLISK